MELEKFLQTFFGDSVFAQDSLRQSSQDLSGQTKAALIQNLPAAFEKKMQKSRAKSTKIIWKWAGLGAASSAMPLPLFDLAGAEIAQKKLRKELLALYNTTEESLSSQQRSQTTALMVGSGVIKMVGKRLPKTIVKWLPAVGIGVAVSRNLHEIRQLGIKWTNELETSQRLKFAMELSKLQAGSRFLGF